MSLSEKVSYLDYYIIVGMGANPGGATGAIAPPRICQKQLNTA